MESFKASTQYGDWEGTAKADDADVTSFSKYLRGKGLMGEGEFFLAISFYSGEHDFTGVNAFVFDKGDDYETVQAALVATDEAIHVREISVELTPQEFLALFKRFSVVLTWHGLKLEGRKYYTD